MCPRVGNACYHFKSHNVPYCMYVRLPSDLKLDMPAPADRVRDWSLITGRGGGGLQNGRGGGHVKFYPFEKGAEKVLAMLKGGHKKFLG